MGAFSLVKPNDGVHFWFFSLQVLFICPLIPESHFFTRQNRLCHCPPFKLCDLHCHLSLFLTIFIFLGHHEQSQPSLFDSWYLTLIIVRVHLTFLEAVVLILKHATFLCLSNWSSESALTHANLHYQEANIDQKIQVYLSTSQRESVKLFVDFIMATHIGLFILTSVTVSEYLISLCRIYAIRVLDILVPSQSKHLLLYFSLETLTNM